MNRTPSAESLAAAVLINDGDRVALFLFEAIRGYTRAHQQAGKAVPAAIGAYETALAKAANAGQTGRYGPIRYDTGTSAWLVPLGVAAGMLGTSARAFRRTTSSGRIATVTIGRRKYVRADHLWNYIAEQETSPSC